MIVLKLQDFSAASVLPDDTIGILLAGSYQDRKGAQAQFTVGNWRPGYTGAENNWGTLAQEGDPRFANIENRPGPTDVYQVPQNAAYDFYNFRRKRYNHFASDLAIISDQRLLHDRPKRLEQQFQQLYSFGNCDVLDNVRFRCRCGK